MGSLEQNTTLVYGIHLRESANDGSDFSNAAADYRVVFLGEDGEWHKKDSSGTVTGFSGGGGTGQGLVDYAFAKRTAGNLTLNATVWTAVDTGTDLTVTAAANDRLEVCLSVGAFGTEAITLNLTAMTVVSATLTNDIATDTAKSDSTLGVAAWRAPSGVSSNLGGCIMYNVVAGDVSGGTVTLRLCYREASGTNRVLTASDPPLHWSVKNIGPAL